MMYPKYYDKCGELMKGYIREGFRNSYEEEPDHECQCIVIDTKGHRFKSRFYRNKFGTWVWDNTKSRGYPFAWWKEEA